MNVGEIVEDALRYPLSDWKKVLIYGFIGLFTTTAVFRLFFAMNWLLLENYKIVTIRS